MQIITEEEFLLSHGFGALSDCDIDRTRLPHGETLRQREKRIKETDAKLSAFYEEKKVARAEYRQLVERGTVRPPTFTEQLIQRANGTDESEQTQAARRICAKRGIDWKLYNE